MSILLAADIGKRRTGLALADTVAGFVVALDTIRHTSDEALLDAIQKTVRERQASEIVIGLPLLPQGKEGEQAAYVRGIAGSLSALVSIPVTLVDERYTTGRKTTASDPDARAACELLSTVLDQRR